MLDNYAVKRLALVLAVQAEIEGMKSENERFKIYGDDPAYCEDAFGLKAHELENLAHANDDQL
tara:strand:- start:64 stop:252 length:189 start_codon:yes stop_codon:yes gene_type:complete